MGVYIKGRRHGTAAQSLLDNFRVNTLLQQDGGVRMPEAVECDALKRKGTNYVVESPGKAIGT